MALSPEQMQKMQMQQMQQMQKMLDSGFEKQAKSFETSMHNKIESVTKLFKEELDASNLALKEELMNMMDQKIEDRMSAMDISSDAGESTSHVLKELTTLKEKVAFWENRSNASTIQSDAGSAWGAGRSAAQAAASSE